MKKQQKGSIVIFALIILIFILIAALSIATISLSNKRSANTSVNSATAFQNSDNGMEDFLQQVYQSLGPDATLDDLANALDHIYSADGIHYQCVDGTGGLPARIGTDGTEGAGSATEFIITAYSDDNIDQHDSGWGDDYWDTTQTTAELTPLSSCSGDILAQVDRFKVAGMYNGAMRAIFVKMQKSISRNLIAHWPFEDRAQLARVIEDHDQRISFVANDVTGRHHPLTLCNIAASSNPEMYIYDVHHPSGNPLQRTSVEDFDNCELNASNGMNPFRGYAKTSMGHSSDPEDDEEYHPDGSWVPGIVEEPITDTETSDVSHNEAMHFDGNTYLAMSNYTQGCINGANCATKYIDVVDLHTQNALTISLWLKLEPPGYNNGTLVSLTDGPGFNLSLHHGKICLGLDEQRTGCTSGSRFTIHDDDWHHVVVSWRNGTGASPIDNHIRFFVDGEKYSTAFYFPGEIHYQGLDNLTIGAVSVPGHIVDYFRGTIDDVRIWDRTLADQEVCEICKSAFVDIDDAKSYCHADCFN